MREFIGSMLKTTEVYISKLGHETGASDDKVSKLKCISQDRLLYVSITNKSKNFSGFKSTDFIFYSHALHFHCESFGKF